MFLFVIGRWDLHGHPGSWIYTIYMCTFLFIYYAEAATKNQQSTNTHTIIQSSYTKIQKVWWVRVLWRHSLGFSAAFHLDCNLQCKRNTAGKTQRSCLVSLACQSIRIIVLLSRVSWILMCTIVNSLNESCISPVRMLCVDWLQGASQVSWVAGCWWWWLWKWSVPGRAWATRLV